MPQLSKPLSTTLNATADGINTVIAAVAGRSIAVYGMALTRTAGGAGLVLVTAVGVAELMRMGTISGTILVLPLGKYPWIKTPAGIALGVFNTTGEDTGGVIVYRYED